jgi:hypothetical protein
MTAAIAAACATTQECIRCVLMFVLRRRCAESNLAYGLSITGRAISPPGGLAL